MKSYARMQAAILLRRLAFQAARISKGAAAESVHDLRVAMRRLLYCLKAFGGFLPAGAVRKIRRKLKAALDLAAAVRDRDIALEFLVAARIPASSAAASALRAARAAAEAELLAELRLWNRRKFSNRWRERLEL